MNNQTMIKQLPDTPNPIVLRTDFFDHIKWEQICDEIRQPVGFWQADVTFLNDQAYQNITLGQLLDVVEYDYKKDFIFLVDRKTIRSSNALILVVDLWGEPGRSFRTPPAQVQAIENNLSMGNMSFYEFAEHTDEYGIFLGF